MRSPLYLVEQGSKLSREGRRLIVSKDEVTLAQVSTIQVSQVIVFGNIQITTPALRLLLEERIEVVLLSEHGQFYGRVVGPENGNGSLRVAQVLCSRDQAFALRTAQQMVYGKVHNSKVFLLRYARRLESEPLRQLADRLSELLQRVSRTENHNSLMGVEGIASAIYFGAWKELLHPPWSLDKRQRRPPPDPVNVLLSFGYTVLTQNVLGAVLTAGLDPHVGFLHQLNYNRPSLALDLVEEFRPVIVDSVVLRCLNNGILLPGHFLPGEGELPVILDDNGKRLFIRELETRLTQEFKHPETGETVTYRRLLLLQAYRLAGTLDLQGQGGVYQPLLVR
jgi:CRISPR-associated protein Cas1